MLFIYRLDGCLLLPGLTVLLALLAMGLPIFKSIPSDNNGTNFGGRELKIPWLLLFSGSVYKILDGLRSCRGLRSRDGASVLSQDGVSCHLPRHSGCFTASFLVRARCHDKNACHRCLCACGDVHGRAACDPLVQGLVRVSKGYPVPRNITFHHSLRAWHVPFPLTSLP